MTVQVQETVFSYVPNGVTVEFPFDCLVLNEADIQVLLDGEEVASGFTVSGVGNPSGGSVIYTIPPTGDELIVRRFLTLERLTDYQQAGDWKASVINPDFDRIVMMAQQLQEQIDRALTLRLGTSGVSLEMPAPEPGRTFKWKADGTGLENSSADPDSFAIAAAASAADAAESEGAANQAKLDAQAAQGEAEEARDVAQGYAASIDPSSLVRKTGDQTIAGIKTFTSSPVVPADFAWHAKPIGEIFFLRDDIVGVSTPPTDNANYRYIKLTAADAYNTGVLTGESVSGSAPLVVATAVISLTGSPLNGRTINLINTERRFIRAGSSGTLEDDSYQAHTHPSTVSATSIWSPTGGGSIANYASGGNSSSFSAMGTGTGRTGTETKPRNIGATAYMRIK